MARDMENGLYQTTKGRILTTNDYVGFGDSEIEDLMPASFLAEVVDRWERRADTAFQDVLQPGKPIVPRSKNGQKLKVSLCRMAGK